MRKVLSYTGAFAKIRSKTNVRETFLDRMVLYESDIYRA